MPVSNKIESVALGLLRDECAKVLSSFPSTIEEDEVVLAGLPEVRSRVILETHFSENFHPGIYTD